MTIYNINPAELEAVAIAASKDQTRLYCCGVWLEENGGMYATDGHRLHGIGLEPGAPIGETCFLENNLLDKILNAVKNERKPLVKTLKDKLRIVVNKDKNKLHISILLEDMPRLSFDATMEAANPADWRRVMPQPPSDKDGMTQFSFNSSYIGDFGKAAKILGQSIPKINFTMGTGNRPALIKIPGYERFTGVLMPMRF